MSTFVEYIRNKWDPKRNQETVKIRKIYFKLAREMNEKFPQYSLQDCYRLIRSRHIYNLKSKNQQSNEDFEKLIKGF